MPHPDKGDLCVALGRHIRELRIARGWSIHRMVVDHGYFDPQWRKMEKGKIAPTIDSLLKLSTIFGIPLPELMSGCGEFPKLNRELAKDAKQPASKAAAKQPVQN